MPRLSTAAPSRQGDKLGLLQMVVGAPSLHDDEREPQQRHLMRIQPQASQADTARAGADPLALEPLP
jgi:hypothetical protein